MIIIRFKFYQRLKILFGWYVQVELWPPGVHQSHASYLLSPVEPERQWICHDQKIAAKKRAEEWRTK